MAEINNRVQKFCHMTDDRLIDIAKECHTAVYVCQCYGSGDMHNYLGAMQELARRGYVLTDCKSNNRLYIRKP